MTKKQKPRRNGFVADFNVREEEDDFILADLDMMLDEEEPSPVPLNHFLDDEDVIDRLLIGANYNADDFSDFDRFVVEPIEQTEQYQKAEAEEDAIDRLLVDAGFDANDELEQDDGQPDALGVDDMSRANEVDVNFERQNVMAGNAGIFDSEESELALDKDATNVFLVKEENPETAKQKPAISETTYPEETLESLNNGAGITPLSSVRNEQEAIKKLINDYENKVKKAAAISYASLGFGIVALLSIVVMGITVSNMQTKVSKLTELVSILEEDMGSIAGKNSDLEINNSDSSLEQLNQKVNSLTERLEKQTQLSSDISENEMTASAAKQAAANKSRDNPQTKPPVLKTKKSSSSEATVKKVSAEKKTIKTQTAAGWSVNLTAYKDRIYAKSKTAKFLQKGIPVKVIAFTMNKTTWYQLKIGGFKNKEEATSYAAKIKKSLHLNSVSVGNN